VFRFFSRRPPLLLFFFILRLPVPGYGDDQEAEPLRFAAIPEDPRPGEPVTLAYAGPDRPGLRAVLLNARGQRLSRVLFFNLPGEQDEIPLKTAILTIPSTIQPGPALVQIEDGNGNRVAELPLTVGSREFISEEIVLDQRNTDIRTQQDPQKTAESAALSAILFRTGTDIFTAGPFIPPVSSTRRTSFFGDRRVFRYVDGSRDTSIHGGIDYGVPRGTPVAACASGRVVLARFRILTGYSVVIEHLPGTYSLYYHLDKILVEEGTLVEGGTQIGESGATGLATGPHLHWEIRVAGENTDPDACVARPILDKAVILSKINGNHGF
jgi:murein DD-endopeptidase MepM/ murein hydrolase activator NlpD